MSPDKENELMLALGRIEGRLEQLSDLPKRVSALERWQSYLKGAWAFAALLLAAVVKSLYGK